MQKSDYPFAYQIRVRYSEIDAQGILYNAHYLTYFDVGITEYFRWLPWDLPAGGGPKEGDDFHLVKAIVDFKAMVVYDEIIDVCVRASRIGTSSISFDMALFGEKAEDDLRATGEVIWVNTNQVTHKSTALPEPLKDLIRARQDR